MNGGAVEGSVFTSRFRPVCCLSLSSTVPNIPHLDYISGVILYHETLTADFRLDEQGNYPWGARPPFARLPLEPATQGLGDLLSRVQAPYEAGARFSKWRAPIICNSSTLPTQAGLEAQVENLARFAATSQQACLVPIVEPDVDSPRMRT